VSTKAKTVAAKTKAKPASKAVVKQVAKPAAGKAVVKSVTQSAVQAKPTAKPAVKVAVKSKPVVKVNPVVKVKPSVKAAVKTPIKAKPVPESQPSAKKATVEKKPMPKATKPLAPLAKPTVPSKAKPTVKPIVNASAKASIKPANPLKTHPSAPASPASVAPTPAPKVAPLAAVPLVKPRVSSRLAQLTVPSMAQSVASTAAKASYSQSVPVTLIVPPLPSSIKKDPKLANNWKTKTADQLSDAELMAMPDSEYMNDKQVAAFRHRLLVLKQDMLDNAGETTEHLREDTVVVPDPADRATIEEEHALELRTRDRERKLLKKIEQSIALIDAGEYGYCDETGEPIGVGRLLARPTATLSLEAQQRRELKQKMFGD
jgi:DnaK suppressor protein